MKSFRVASALACAAVGFVAAAQAPRAHAAVTITPAPGYGIGYNGNEGDFFTPNDPAPVPDNLALASNGSVPFADPALVSPHEISDLNNGLYGNTNSYISGAGTSRTGIDLAGTTAYNITSFAFGRDNGNNVSDACGGQCSDRDEGLYTLYRTLVPDPDLNTPVTGDAATGFEAIGTLDYASDDEVIGGGFTSHFRHEYTLSQNGSPVQATGFRIDTPVGNAVDEIELYGTPVPEPTALGVLAAAGAGLLTRRRRRR